VIIWRVVMAIDAERSGRMDVRMIVGGDPVMMFRMIVPDVLVDVQGRAPGHRRDQRPCEHEREERAHTGSVLRLSGTMTGTGSNLRKRSFGTGCVPARPRAPRRANGGRDRQIGRAVATQTQLIVAS
jgi:hypothetical protein